MYFINLCTAQLFRSLFNNTASLAVVTKDRMRREHDQEWELGKEAFCLFRSTQISMSINSRISKITE